MSNPKVKRGVKSTWGLLWQPHGVRGTVVKVQGPHKVVDLTGIVIPQNFPSLGWDTPKGFQPSDENEWEYKICKIIAKFKTASTKNLKHLTCF